MSLDERHGLPTRRIVVRAVLLVTLLVASAVALPYVLRAARPGSAPAARRPEGPTADEIAASRRADIELARARRSWESSETLAPREERLEANGEVTAPFHGFGVSVDVVPEGARVFVDGRDVGEAPIVASVRCEPGATVDLRVEKPPYRPRRQTTSCRADTLVKISARLER